MPQKMALEVFTAKCKNHKARKKGGKNEYAGPQNKGPAHRPRLYSHTLFKYCFKVKGYSIWKGIGREEENLKGKGGMGSETKMHKGVEKDMRLEGVQGEGLG